MIRRAETDADLERCVEIFNAVVPEQPMTLADMSTADGAILLHEDGGYAYVMESSHQGRAFAMIRVRPDVRGRGIGSALLTAVEAEARRLGQTGTWGRIQCNDSTSRAWAASRDFRETLQDIRLVRQVAPGDGKMADGIVPLRDEHVAGAYEVEVECVPDIPATNPLAASPFERWHARRRRDAVTFVALDGDRVVGLASLQPLHGTPHRLEHGLTAVLRSHRGRGIATKLKSAQIAWAAEHGFRELITHTDSTNLPMRRVNVKLGYVEELGPFTVERDIS